MPNSIRDRAMQEIFAPLAQSASTGRPDVQSTGASARSTTPEQQFINTSITNVLDSGKMEAAAWNTTGLAADRESHIKLRLEEKGNAYAAARLGISLEESIKNVTDGLTGGMGRALRASDASSQTSINFARKQWQSQAEPHLHTWRGLAEAGHDKNEAYTEWNSRAIAFIKQHGPEAYKESQTQLRNSTARRQQQNLQASMQQNAPAQSAVRAEKETPAGPTFFDPTIDGRTEEESFSASLAGSPAHEPTDPGKAELKRRNVSPAENIAKKARQDEQAKADTLAPPSSDMHFNDRLFAGSGNQTPSTGSDQGLELSQHLDDTSFDLGPGRQALGSPASQGIDELDDVEKVAAMFDDLPETAARRG